MVNILMYISSGLILSAFIGYILLILFNSNKTTKYDGFNITKDILNEYDSINIVENKNYFTVYNIRRKVIKIASKCYYGKSISDLSIPLMEAGISVVDNNKNRFIFFVSKIISNLKYLYIIPILAVIFNSVSSGTIDAKIGLFLLAIAAFISYFLISIKSEAIIWLNKKITSNKEINKIDGVKITSFINKIILLDKIIFIGELAMIIKFIAVVLGMW